MALEDSEVSQGGAGGGADLAETLLEEIILNEPPGMSPQEFTISQYIEVYEQLRGERLGRNMAQRRLDKLVDDGLLTKRSVIYGGRNRFAYGRRR